MILPKDLGLPEKFTSWRPGQLEAAAAIIGNDKYAFLLDAPTGVGKSLVAATVQKLLEKNITYVCTTKQLQDQLLKDFPYAKTVKGRSNYPCRKYPRMFPKITAEICTHTKANPCKFRNSCLYIWAKREALGAPIAILNTAYFLSEVNYVGAFSEREFLVIDEFDTMENQLMGFIELVITQRQLSRLNLPPPKFKTKPESWIPWAEDTMKVIRPEIDKLQTIAGSEGEWGGIDFNEMRRLQALQRLYGKLSFFVKEVDKNWVWYPGEDKWTFRPTWVGKYASGVLWKHAKKVLGMSATILDPRQVSANVGLHLGEYKYRAMPSPFPIENRQIYYEPCANVINKNMDVALPALAKGLKAIMEKHPSDRILVHTVSYKVRDYLLRNIGGDRFRTHSMRDRITVLEEFKKSDKPLVLLSPSMDRGVDLPDEECRIDVIAKCPYPDLGDPQVNKRVHASKDGSSWYAYHTVSKIVQMSGRACRSVTDYSTTYILDSQFNRLYNEYRHLFPNWWKEALIL